MNPFSNLFKRHGAQDSPALRAAIARSVAAVEPLLIQAGGYPDRYRKPVCAALEYANRLAAGIPGPVMIDHESYAHDAFVHALFPDINSIAEAISSSLALQENRHLFPPDTDLYALMGMRRVEKKVMGMELAGQTVQRDVVQQAIYFTSHTIDHPSISESQARELIAMGFFDSLAGKVKKRIDQRKQDKMALMTEKDMLMSQLRTSNDRDRPALEKQLAALMDKLQTTAASLELRNYTADFEAVLLRPEKYLHMDQTPIVLDSMGIRRTSGDTERGKAIIFNELIGYDRRDWTVTLVRLINLQNESFADKLEKAYRRLAL